MERVGILIDKLQKQYQQKADVQNILVTVQLLHNELLLNVNHREDNDSKKVAVVVPNTIGVAVEPLQYEDAAHSSYKPVPKPEAEPAPVAEPTPEPEVPMPEDAPLPTPRPEPEPIPHFVEQNPWHSVFPSKEDKK